MRHNGIQQITEAEHGGGGHRDRITDAKIVKLIYIRHEFFEAVHLVDRQNHRLSGAPEQVGHLAVRIHKPLAHIGDKNDHIRRVDGDLCLLPHVREHHIPALRLNPAGIDHGKLLVQPGNIRINAIPRHARRIFDNRDPLPCESIEQC